MILKGFREKSNKKYFNKLLANRTVSLASKPIESLGVILNIDEFSNLEALKSLSKTLNISPNKFQCIAFSSVNKEVETIEFPCYSEKDIGWRGSIKNNELQLFLDTKFDALVSYYNADELDLKVLTAASKAEFKIGILQEEQRLNDLIINVNPEAIEVFKTELLKYLSILKRI
ncbi:conserved hypothetical protein [Formosa agariphila KMM 3901]|uniref:Uncharacterized protein n=1 Tax=Formosa agariphila (strain DSM 15362 / KCTC 12365 / LMG 23005 / KMM 3901 / M-2Alg 35-1) TaxID=1347342 RepID=T2KQ11_FORAG|nr:hypothetical protein [Formosa agariphila]CDF80084.1 conserved hypothetical protein [Formosa agariphila KMM 3901]